MSMTSSSGNNSKGLEETHNSDTVADETGLGEHPGISEVPPTRLETQLEEERSKVRKWMPVTIVVGILAVCAIIGLAVGLTKRDDDEDDAVTTSRMSKGTWLPVGAAVMPQLGDEHQEDQDNNNNNNEQQQQPPPFEYWNFDCDGTSLVVADFDPQDLTPQVQWYDFDNTTQDWVHQTTLPLGDEHVQTFPLVKVAHGTLVVADPLSDDLHPDMDTVETHNGMVAVYHFVRPQQEQDNEHAVPYLEVRFQAAAGDMWGSAIALDDTATRLAVGTPMATQPMNTELRHQGVVHVYNLKDYTLESIGRPLYGPHFLSTLGSHGLAVSGNGQVLAATAIGQVWIWRWNTVTQDWSEAVALGPAVGHRVVLNHDGTVLATTTFTDTIVLYKYTCQNEFICGWNLQGSWPGTFVTLLSDEDEEDDGMYMAIGHKNNEDAVDVVQVYEYKDNAWFRMGSAIPGVTAIFMNKVQILVQAASSSGALQTWQWAPLE